MQQIDGATLKELLDYPSLIQSLKAAFRKKIIAPLRHHHDFNNPKEKIPSTLLLMPAWEEGTYLGIKLVIVSPNNYIYKIPSIQGQYLLFNAHTGQQLAQMDAKSLTNLRTAAASALAADYLAHPNASSLLMMGTGALAPHLIEAHTNIRPIKQIWVWGRNFEKAKSLCSKLTRLDISIEAVEDYASVVEESDIISAATLSQYPILDGKYLRAGQHIDLVGSFKPDMRETNDIAIQKSNIFVDTLEGAPKESGDISQPIKNGILSVEDIKGDLFSLCQGTAKGRVANEEITLFKSVGHALEDLAAAVLAFERLQQKSVIS